MTAAVKDKATTAKPEAKKAATPAPAPAVAPVEDKPARTNPAQAPDDIRVKITQAMADLRAAGFTRPSISAVTKLSDSQVWRAQNGLVHTVEVPVIEEFIKQVLAGDVKPPERKTGKVSASVLQEKVAKATELLGKQADAKSVTALRALVKEALDALA